MAVQLHEILPELTDLEVAIITRDWLRANEILVHIIQEARDDEASRLCTWHRSTENHFQLRTNCGSAVTETELAAMPHPLTCQNCNRKAVIL